MGRRGKIERQAGPPSWWPVSAGSVPLSVLGQAASFPASSGPASPFHIDSPNTSFCCLFHGLLLLPHHCPPFWPHRPRFLHLGVCMNCCFPSPDGSFSRESLLAPRLRPSIPTQAAIPSSALPQLSPQTAAALPRLIGPSFFPRRSPDY